jgi:hypothetical protein
MRGAVWGVKTFQSYTTKWKFNLNFWFEVIRKHFMLTILVSWVMTSSVAHSVTRKSNAIRTRPFEIVIALNYMYWLSTGASFLLYSFLWRHIHICEEIIKWPPYLCPTPVITGRVGEKFFEISNFQNWVEHVLATYHNIWTRHLHLKM